MQYKMKPAPACANVSRPMKVVVVTLYTRQKCHLCEEAKKQMAPLLKEFGATLREVDIDADPALRAEYTNDVPVIFIAGRKAAKHRVDLRQFRKQLAAAQGTEPEAAES